MSVLNNEKFRRFFGLADREDPLPVVHTPTLEERLGEASANRGYAFDLIEDARDALKDSAQTEYEVAQELLRRAEQGRIAADESARRILASAAASAVDKEEKASVAQRNADDDHGAYVSLDALLAAENADA